MLPTFLPGGVSRPTVVGLPACLCLPPPCGWDAAIIAWPLTTGHFRPRDFCRNHFGPAFKNGFSVRPAPATTPIIARHLSLDGWFARRAYEALFRLECGRLPVRSCPRSGLAYLHLRDGVLYCKSSSLLGFRSAT